MTSLDQQIRGLNQPPILSLKLTNSIPHVSIPKSYSRALGGILLVAVMTAVFLYWSSITGDSSLPPLFQKYHAAERKYPQHDESLPFPEGKHAKFIHFQNHQKGVGWGNVLQEMIFDAHLAFELRRSFIFDNYTWDRYGDYTKDLNGKIIPFPVAS
ncbi:hypothetical protein C8J56DRAFT_1119219 [Mycena floridula]|nr:hypothetical protein C8J56DRAFT_1119219 [Mycena floridula]